DSEACYQCWDRLADAELIRSEQECRARQAVVVERRKKSLAQFVATRDEKVRGLEARRRTEFQEAAHIREAALSAAGNRHNQTQLEVESSQRKESLARKTR